MKKILSAFLTITLIYSHFSFEASAASDTVTSFQGEGSESNPFKIATEADLYEFATQVNAGTTFKELFFEQVADITLTEKFTSIGKATASETIDKGKAFKGTYDGGNHTITNLSINQPSTDAQGLFGYIDGATLKNIKVSGTVIGKGGTGMLVGIAQNDVTIENCHTSGSVSTTNGSGYRVGGLVGWLDLYQTQNLTTTIRGCSSSAEVQTSASNGYYVGGLIGHIMIHGTGGSYTDKNNTVTITDSSASGSVKTTGAGAYYVGGLIGFTNITGYSSGSKITVENSYATGNVSTSGTGAYYVGGLIGFTNINENSPGSKITVENSHATGNVSTSGTTAYYVGGLIGYSENTTSSQNQKTPIQTTVKNCYATGDVSCNTYDAGGLIGHIHAGDYLKSDTALIEDCYATGNVSSNTAIGHGIGGLIGRPTKNVTIRNSYANGDVYGGCYQVGGLIGYSEGNVSGGKVTVENCYATGNVVGRTYQIGGLIGHSQATNVSNSYAIGSVYGPGVEKVGGLIGHVAYGGNVVNCYAAGTVSNGSHSYTGGLIGFIEGKSYNEAVVKNCYFDTTTTMQTKGYGYNTSYSSINITGKTTNEMIHLSDWDIQNNLNGAAQGSGDTNRPWYIDNDVTYPYLWYQYDGQTAQDVNYNMGELKYSTETGEVSLTTRADFSFQEGGKIQFEATTAGAARAYFPYTYGNASSDYNSYQYWFDDDTISIPKSDAYSFTANQLYSLGSISASDIVAFSSSVDTEVGGSEGGGSEGGGSEGGGSEGGGSEVGGSEGGGSEGGGSEGGGSEGGGSEGGGSEGGGSEGGGSEGGGSEGGGSEGGGSEGGGSEGGGSEGGGSEGGGSEGGGSEGGGSEGGGSEAGGSEGGGSEGGGSEGGGSEGGGSEGGGSESGGSEGGGSEGGGSEGGDETNEYVYITYYTNGGTGDKLEDTAKAGDNYIILTVNSTGFTNTGHTFKEWNTKADGSGTGYPEKYTFKISESMTLYAQWSRNSSGGSSKTYTVTYNANSGTGSHRDSGLSSGTTYTIKSDSTVGIVREGYKFTGWNTVSGGTGTAYSTDDTFKISGNVILYAQWKSASSDDDSSVSTRPALNTEDHMAYVIGYPDGTVRPSDNITRAEVSTIFFRLLTTDSRNAYWSTSNTFNDISNENWFNNAVSTMHNADIIAGYADGTFGGNRRITRAEFAAIAARFDASTYTGANKFSDISGHWAAEYINLAAEKGWITGYSDGTFRPDQYITRAEAMTLINRVLGRDNITEMHTAMKTWSDNPSTAWYYEAVQEATNAHEYNRNTATNAESWTKVTDAPDWAALEKI